MNVLIVEDEDLSAERLQKMILGIDPSIHVLAIIPSVFETIAYLQNDSKTQPARRSKQIGTCFDRVGYGIECW